MTIKANDDRIDVLRRHALAIFQAGVDAADPYRAVQSCLRVDGQHLVIRTASGERSGTWSKIHLIAFGKAACRMSAAALATLPPEKLAERAIAVTHYGNVESIPGLEVLGAGHPLPDAAGFNAAQRVAKRAQAASPGELVLILVSGGGSALIPYPVNGVSLADKSVLTQALLACGAAIGEINCVRKHLSQIKGGGLARLVYPADCHALILSDVLGDDLSAIASGPTVPDPTTFADAIEILKQRNLWQDTPVSIRQHLQQGLNATIPETPKPGDPCFDRCGLTLVGSNRISLDSIAISAKNLGYETTLYSDRLEGIAKQTAEAWVQAARNQITEEEKPRAFVAGGETTVIVKGKGRGGRNQEIALAFALAAERHALTKPWVFLSGGTDGRDGPTDAAGGLVDSESLNRMRTSGLDPVNYLTNNDAYPALKASGDLLMTGPTGTNVADLQILLFPCRIQ